METESIAAIVDYVVPPTIWGMSRRRDGSIMRLAQQSRERTKPYMASSVGCQSSAGNSYLSVVLLWLEG